MSSEPSFSAYTNEEDGTYAIFDPAAGTYRVTIMNREVVVHELDVVIDQDGIRPTVITLPFLFRR